MQIDARDVLSPESRDRPKDTVSSPPRRVTVAVMDFIAGEGGSASGR